MPLSRRRSIIVAAAIGGVLVGLLIVLLVRQNLSTTDDRAAATTTPSVSSAPAPVTATPGPPAPTATTPAPMTPEVFAAFITKNVGDINKDLNDLDTALAASNVLRIASNDQEIDYGLRQLQAAEPPAAVATDWQISLQVVELRVQALTKDIRLKDYAAATADVAAIRTELVQTQSLAG